MKLLVSACLLGISCRYNGQCVTAPGMEALLKTHAVIPVCLEQLGGLPTPREPSEIREGRVLTKSGRDVTAEYRRGAEEALRLARLCGCQLALLQERSPSCGHGRIHDGSFSGGMTDGSGVTAALLEENRIPVLGASRVGELLQGGENAGPAAAGSCAERL